MEEIMKEIIQIFAPGNLADKQAEITELMKKEAIRIFEDGVSWEIKLPEHDKEFSGYSKNLYNALSDVSSCLCFLSSSHESDTKVICAISR
jgi:hypothetical protein